MSKNIYDKFTEELSGLVEDYKEKSKNISKSIQENREAFYMQRVAKFSAQEDLPIELRENIIKLLDKYFPKSISQEIREDSYSCINS